MPLDPGAYTRPYLLVLMRQVPLRSRAIKTLYLICNMGFNPKKVVNVTDDALKAEHFRELYEEQGGDMAVIEVCKDILDKIDYLDVLRHKEE